MSLLDRIRPGAANERARIIVMAAEHGMGDDDARTFADTFKSFEDAKAELDRRAAEKAATGKAAKPGEIVRMVATANLGASLAAELIEEGVSLEAAQARVNAAWAAAGDNHVYAQRASVGRSWDHGEGFRAKAADALSAMLDPTHAPTMGRGLASSLCDLAMATASAEGHRPASRAEAVAVVMASHTRSDFPLIVADSMTNVIGRGLQQQRPAITRLSHEVPADSYHAGKSITLSSSAMPEEVGEGGELRHTTMEEKGEALPVPRDFASIFRMSNKLIQDDRLDLLQQATNRMIRGSVERLRAVLLEPLLANSGAGQTMADGSPLFDASRGNAAASGAAITLTSISAARVAMRRQKGPLGELYAVEPGFILVPPEMETAAQQMIADIQAAKFSDANPFSGSMEIVTEPGLTNATAWYLVGDPRSFDGLAHAFLDGQSGPRVESRIGWETLGAELRLTWAVDAKFVEHASWYRNAGA
jgi:hypothetical protein